MSPATWFALALLLIALGIVAAAILVVKSGRITGRSFRRANRVRS